MSMLKKLLAVALTASISAGAAVAGTVAYLQDTDEDVNVMTLGNVYIDQIEMERVTQTNSGTDELKSFTNAKPLYPAVGEMKWVETGSGRVYQEWPTGGSSALFDAGLKNVQDKIVFVENTGKSDAYVRTWFAFEAGAMTVDEVNNGLIHWNRNSTHWTWSDFDENMTAVIDGAKYYLRTATYTGSDTVHTGGILPDGETTRPSLLQLFLDSDAGNDDMTKIDGNGNGTYDILVFSQAVQAEGFANAETALNTAFGTAHPWTDDFVMPTVVDTAEELTDALTDAGAAGAGDTTIVIADDLDLTDVNWTPIKVDGYHGADVVTIEGGGHTITGLNAPLFAGGFAGGSGIVINDLTIDDSNIVSKNTLGSGAFIESVDSMTVITLNNCHLTDSTVTGGAGSRTGGLIGWTAGYNKENDGPVKTYVTIEDCSVVNCTITCDGSVGGIYGHAGNNAWTYSTVKNCTVKDCKLNSTDDGDWRVGVVVGTANVGELTISGITESGNTLSQTGKTAPTGQSNYYGRFVPGTTGKLVIDGVAVQ